MKILRMLAVQKQGNINVLWIEMSKALVSFDDRDTNALNAEKSVTLYLPLFKSMISTLT